MSEPRYERVPAGLAADRPAEPPGVLREALKAWLADTDHDWTGVDWDDPYGARADALLSGPLADVLAENARLRAELQGRQA